MMGFFRKFVAVTAVATCVSACGDSKQVIQGTYEEAIKIATVHMERTGEAWSQAAPNLCAMSDEQWTAFVGGLASGTLVTGLLAGDSVMLVMTSYGTLAVVAPAVATGVVVAAGTVAATYGGVKGYCHVKEIA